MPVIPSYVRGGAALTVSIAAGLAIGLAIPRGGGAGEVASGDGLGAAAEPVDGTGPALEPPGGTGPALEPPGGGTGITGEAAPEAVAIGTFLVDVVSHDCGIAAVTGDHAQWLADGSYCRVRVWVTNADVLTRPFDAMVQELVLEDGETLTPEHDAMNISEQPRELDLGREVRIEFDLWFDVPDGAVPVALRWHEPGGGTADTPLPG